MRTCHQSIIISLCTPTISRKADFFLQIEGKRNKHSEKYLAHQFTASVFMEKRSFVDVRKLGPVFGNSAP